MNIYISILANIFYVATIAQTGDQSAPKPSAAIAIAVEQTPRVRVAFLPHRGAYWSVGPTISKVRSVLAEQNAATQLFVRYQTDPRRISPRQLEAKVGFVLEIGKVAPEGFQAETQPPELVAWMKVDGSLSSLARHYTTLEKWAKENGYQPLGPVIEKYPPVHTGTPRIVLQLVVRKEDTAVQPQTQHTGATPIANDRVVRLRANSKPVATSTYAAKIPRPSQPTESTQPPTGRAALPAASDPAPLTQPEPPVSRAPLQPERPLTQDYIQLALRLIPPRADWSHEQVATLGPKVMRVRAIAHLAKTRFGAEAAGITNLSNALTNRYTQVLGKGLASTVKQPARKRDRTHRAEDPDGPLARLDRVFSDMLTDRIDAAQVETVVLSVLTGQAKPVPDAVGPKLP